jgi:hypothetical protein
MGFCSLYLSRGCRLERLAEQPGVAQGTLRKHYANATGPSDRRQAAVDGYHGSGEERSFVRCEEQCSRHDFFGSGDPLH